MDTQNLQAFLFVAESASFSGAAEKLHLTQPAVSKRIAQLEAQLDTPLFDRIGRTVDLTEAGHALLPHARAVQVELQAAERSVRDLAGEVGRHFQGTPEQRVTSALDLGRRSLEVFLSTLPPGTSRGDAVERLRRVKQSGRRPSRVAQGSRP